MASETPAKPKTGLSLYANLLDPSSKTESEPPGTISRAPVVFKQAAGNDEASESAAQKQQISAGSYQSPCDIL